jgi:NAD(P)-dependent dehydrogenase (short-subunit alcohol dehydrogenase family)
VLPVAAHCREQKTWKNLFEKTRKEYGRIDILVNNAPPSPRHGNLTDMGLDMYDQVMNTNLRGCFILCQMAGQADDGPGRRVIVNISSWAALSRERGWVYTASARRGEYAFQGPGGSNWGLIT